MSQSDIDKTRELEEKFDPEMRFRPIRNPAALLVTSLLIVLSCFHFYTAGFGLLRETTHRGIHLAFVLGLIFLVFPLRKAMLAHPPKPGLAAPGSVPWYDWLLAVGIALSVLYIPYIFDDLAFRVGNPSTLDVAMGSVLVVLLLEATRRAMGWPLPIIALLFMTYALAGSWFPGTRLGYRDERMREALDLVASRADARAAGPFRAPSTIASSSRSRRRANPAAGSRCGRSRCWRAASPDGRRHGGVALSIRPGRSLPGGARSLRKSGDVAGLLRQPRSAVSSVDGGLTRGLADKPAPATSGNSRIFMSGERSSQNTASEPPTAAIHSVSRVPIAVARRPAAKDPSGRTP